MSTGGTSWPRLRRWVMQFSLWLVLAAMLGLAALVRRQLLRVRPVELSQATAVGNMTVPLPVGWVQQMLPDGVALIEPAKGPRPRRQIEIHRTATTGFVSPLEYLARTGAMAAPPVMADAREAGQETLSVISVAGWPGIIRSRTDAVGVGRVPEPLLFKQLIACAILPSGDVVLMRLEDRDEGDGADEDLVRRMAGALRLTDQPPPLAQRELRLGGDIRFAVPPTLTTMAGDDPFRTSRTFFVQSGYGWLAVDLTPCIVLDDPATQLKPLLLLRDLAYGPGEVQQVDEQVWSCQRRADGPFPGAAYLMVDSGGEAVLAEFRWNSISPRPAEMRGQVEVAWQQIKANIAFPANSGVAELVRRGEGAIESLPKDPAELLPPDWQEVLTWQWFDDATPHTAQAIARYELGAESLHYSQLPDLTPPLIASGQELVDWYLSRDGSSYRYICRRLVPRPSLTQISELKNGVLHTRIFRGQQPLLDSRSDDLGPYVPGGLLPLVLGKLPNKKMVLRSESFLGIAAAAAPPLLILSPTADESRTMPGQQKPMRCWSIEVNGTGLVSHWYFDEAGQLMIVDLPGKLHVQRKEKTVAPPTTSRSALDEKVDD